MTDPPVGWQRVRLGDVLRLRNGRAFKESEWTTSGRPIIRIQNLKSTTPRFNHYDGALPDQFVARAGDLLFAWSGTPGTSFGAHVWDGPEAYINQHIFRVDFSSEDFDRDYLKLALDANLDAYIAGAQGGVGLAHITKSKLDNSSILAPPLDVQLALAKLIDRIELMRGSTADHVATAQSAIGRFRRAALAAAYDEAVAGDGKGGEASLEAILREPLKNGYSARPVRHETPYRVLTLTATTSGWFNASHFKFTDEEFPPESPFWLHPGDIVIQRGNTAEYVGVPAVYDGLPRQYIYPDLMIRVRVRDDIAPRFVWYMLLAPQARKFLRDRATGSAGNMPKINQKVLAAVPVPIPDMSVRNRLVERLDAAFKLADAVEQRSKVAVHRIERSSRAILAKAFRGELALLEASEKAP